MKGPKVARATREPGRERGEDGALGASEAQEAVMLDIDGVESRIAGRVKIKRARSRQLAARRLPLDTDREAEGLAAAPRAQKKRRDRRRQGRQPCADPRPGEKEAAPDFGFEGAPFALQHRERRQWLASDVDGLGHVERR